MRVKTLVSPVVKWVGGKRQLLQTFAPLLPQKTTPYYEPFLGGGAMLFYLQPRTAFVNDINQDLMEVYATVKGHVEDLIKELETYQNTPEFFYEIRDLDRNRKAYQSLTDVKKAARILYLNKTCFNGLYRVNNAGEFNAPFGYYRNPNIVNAPVLRAVSAYFNAAKVQFSSVDYEEALQNTRKGAFVYLDPPYDPVSNTSSFTGYTRGGFSKEDQIRLRQCCDDLHRRGVKFLLSNSSTEFIWKLYGDNPAYHIVTVQAKRAVNSVGNRRGDIDEVVIRNYE